ncbi:HAD-IIA family hydrolase [Sphingobacterium phlebotomi]|uniref:HAD-IIA family hydrolase n=1 Tax=Sphingobacterium phlebotomi TaxID=2605433 RepID=A0A5D4H254_9SPHI|nr:HAD-IIA family hydrolase [Sphingobacterium phlebotomi]TYR33585.1 HAD-IIA family hydrolase [Sphingobacterium phlebotomi]
MTAYAYIGSAKLDTTDELYNCLKNIKHIALDMDGTIYNGSTLFPFTIPFLAKLKEKGIGYSFLTNNPSKSTEDYLGHLTKMGIHAVKEEMYTSAQATIEYIKTNMPKAKRLFILGTPSMISEFERAGFESTEDDENDIPDVVVVGFDMTLSYARLCRASWWVAQKLPYIATNPDRVCPTDKKIILVDCGAIYTCIEYATGRLPDRVIGKPNPGMLDGILERYKLDPSEVLMVGDRIYTDVKMAQNAGAVGVLVLSGETTMDIVQDSDTVPDIIAEDLEELQHMLIAAMSLT